MIARSLLGTSMPSVERPGMRSMRTDSAFSASARSSCRLTIWLTLTPGRRLELEDRDHRPGADPLDRALDAELGAAAADRLAQAHQLGLVDGAPAVAHLEEVDRRQRPGRDLGRRRAAPAGAPAPLAAGRRRSAGWPRRRAAAPDGARGTDGNSSSSLEPPRRRAPGGRAKLGLAPCCSVTAPPEAQRQVESRSGGGRRRGRTGRRAPAPSDGRCAVREPAASPVFFCFSSATRCRCLVMTRRRARSFSRRSRRRSRASVQLCQSCAQAVAPGGEQVAERRLDDQGGAAGDRGDQHQRASRTKLKRASRRSDEQLAEGAAGRDRAARASAMRPRASWSRAGSGGEQQQPRRSRGPPPAAARARRSRRQPATSRKNGTSRQVRPRKPNASAATWAPTAPIQLCGAACARRRWWRGWGRRDGSCRG